MKVFVIHIYWVYIWYLHTHICVLCVCVHVSVRLADFICCRRRRGVEAFSSTESVTKYGSASPKSRVSRLLRSSLSSISAGSSLSGTPVDKRPQGPSPQISPAASVLPNGEPGAWIYCIYCTSFGRERSCMH